MNKLYQVELPIADGYAITGVVAAESAEFAITRALTDLNHRRPEVAAIAAQSISCSAEEIGLA